MAAMPLIGGGGASRDAMYFTAEGSRTGCNARSSGINGVS